MGDSTWRVVDDGDGPAVLLVHGLPGLAFDWRHQIGPLVRNGFRVIAPDLPGVGGSGTIDRCTWSAGADALLDLLDSLDVVDVLAVGHDIGAALAWTLAQRHPHRVRALMLMSLPYLPARDVRRPSLSGRGPAEHVVTQADLDAELHERLSDRPGEFMRRTMFALSASGGALPEHGGDVIDRLSPAPATPWPWLSTDELALYVNTYAHTGFVGMLQWYRDADETWEHLPDTPRVLDVPAYFLDGERDPALTRLGRDAVGAMRAVMPRLYAVHTYDGAGHFIAAEAAGPCTAAVVGFARSTV